ncbi:MAG: Hsp20/alpha crystallin family protein [Proteobacteria bacterium]|nr:Hsp20/alpha crystallin family protein [Pseudomonadota bacterium]
MAITKYRFRYPSYSPWRELEDVQNRIAGFFDNPPASRRSWTPSVNVSETKDGLAVTAELPGLSEENLSIELEENVLTISGEKTEQVTEGDEERRYHVWERSYGSFRRSFSLPRTISGDDVTATFENGVLTILLPKAPEAKGRTIEIAKN